MLLNITSIVDSSKYSFQIYVFDDKFVTHEFFLKQLKKIFHIVVVDKLFECIVYFSF